MKSDKGSVSTPGALGDVDSKRKWNHQENTGFVDTQDSIDCAFQGKPAPIGNKGRRSIQSASDIHSDSTKKEKLRECSQR
jgi:hypothetical protein